MSERTELAKGFTVRDYRQAVKDQNAAAIADAIRRRFRERYLCEDLKATTWNDPRWKKVRHKMDAIADHCTVKP